MGVIVRPQLGAADARSNFVDSILADHLNKTGSRVSDEIRAFVLTEVLEPDDVWGARSRDIAEERTRRVLVECLDAVQARPGQGDLSNVEQARESFYAIIHDEWNCPFPFIFC